MDSPLVQEHIGSLISADCGASLGVYQGRIIAVNLQTQSITLEEPFRNGKPFPVPQVTLKSSDIHDVKVLKLAHEFSPPTMVRAPRPTRRPPRPGSYAEFPPTTSQQRNNNGQHVAPLRQVKSYTRLSPDRFLSSFSSFSGQQGTEGASKRVGVRRRSFTPDPPGTPSVLEEEEDDGFGNRPDTFRRGPFPMGRGSGGFRGNRGGRGRGVAGGLSPRKLDAVNEQGKKSYEGKGRTRRLTIPGEDEFGTVIWNGQTNDHLNAPLDMLEMGTDFDFEGNLALFDKQTELSKIAPPKAAPPRNFRHDQNIIEDESRVYVGLKRGKDDTKDDRQISGSTVDQQRQGILAALELGRASISPELFRRQGVFKTADGRGVSVPTVAADQKRRALRDAMRADPSCTEEFLAGNMARGLADIILGSVSKSIPNGRDEKSPAKTQNIVILSGSSKISQLTAGYLSNHLINRNSGNHVTIYVATSGSAGKCYPKEATVLSGHKTQALPKPTETGLIVSLLNFPELSPDLNHAISDWIRTPTSAQFVSVEADPTETKDNLRCYWNLPLTACSSKTPIRLVDVGLPYAQFDSFKCEQLTSKVSDQLALIFAHGFLVQLEQS